MRMRVVALCVLLFSACGGCDDDGEKSSGVQDEEFGDVLGAFCDVIERCPNAVPYPITYRSRGECVQILNFGFTCRLVDAPTAANENAFTVERRMIDVDQETRDACVEYLNETNCDEVITTGSDNRDDNPCTGLFNFDDDDDQPSGSAGLDEDCNSDEDCQGDLFCAGGGVDPEKLVSLCQVCRPRLEQGTPCQQYTRDCAEGLYCIYVPDGARTCEEKTDDDEDCVEHEQCKSGFCNYAKGMDLGGWGACDPDGNVGDPCTDETEEMTYNLGCRPELHCDNGDCAERGANGDSCTDNWECQRGTCTDGECGFADGQNCSEHEDCLSEICDGGLCVPSDGTVCTSNAMCGSGETCEGLCLPPNCECSGCPVGQCVSTGQNNANNNGNETCEDDFDCLLGRCENGVCTESSLGSACSQSYECYPLGFCSGGTCVERLDPGADCEAIDSCKEPFICKNGSCELINLACEPGRAGEECAFLQVCDDQSWCDLLDNFTCKKRAEVGESCGSILPNVETCVKSAFCSNGLCVVRPKSGEECTVIPCVDGSFCAGGTCQDDPIGRPCEFWEDNPCPDGLICDDDLERCLPPKPQGSDCRDTFECEAGLYCKDYDSCEPRVDVGGECFDTEVCKENLYCERDTNTCVARLGLGDICDRSDQSCEVGMLCEYAETDYECQAGRPNGEGCSSDYECASSLCVENTCLETAECEAP